MSEWISVKDRLPEIGNWYLVFERERLETIYNRMDGEQHGNHAVSEGMERLDQLIRELKGEQP